MERVTGIGGLFFRSKNPAATAEWYKEHLGIDLVPTDYNQKSWSQEAGPTVFAPFPEDTEYFGDAARQWMINFRVNDLDAMVGQLRLQRLTSPSIRISIRTADSPVCSTRKEIQSSSGSRNESVSQRMDLFEPQ